MLFPTIDFAIFFAIAFTVNWLLNPYAGWWKLSMIGLSYVFYGWVGWSYCLLLLADDVGDLRRRRLGQRHAHRARAAHRHGRVGRRPARRSSAGSSTTASSRSTSTTSPTPWAWAGPSPCCRWRCRSPSPSSPSWRSATWSTSTGASSSRPSRSTSRSTSPSSPTCWPGRSCGAASCCPRSAGAATPTRSTTHGPSG